MLRDSYTRTIVRVLVNQSYERGFDDINKSIKGGPEPNAYF